MIVLPSPLAFENELSEYFDDYYIDISLSSVEGKIYCSTAIKPAAKDSSAAPAPKESVAIVHLKVTVFVLLIFILARIQPDTTSPERTS